MLSLLGPLLSVAEFFRMKPSTNAVAYISKRSLSVCSTAGGRVVVNHEFEVKVRYSAYCASPLPNDQFSFFTSTRLMKASSRRSPTASWSPSASAL